MKKTIINKMKKVISTALAVVMIISLFPLKTGMNAYAEEDPYVELTNTLTAQDTFAWTEYDHDDYTDRYLGFMSDHIIYDGNNIQMVGYGVSPFKDFLFVDNHNEVNEYTDLKQTFTFDIQRDSTSWHSMECGGFLFNSSIKDGVLNGFGLLITNGYIKLIRLQNMNVANLHEGAPSSLITSSNTLKSVSFPNSTAVHSMKIEVYNNTISVWDGDTKIIDSFTLPQNDYGYGYGPITSYASHSCSQKSYFTFADIKMEEVVIHYIPKKPAALSYSVNKDSSVTLNWTQPEGKAEVVGYNIYRDGSLIGTTVETAYTDETAVSLGDFTYYVCAYDNENYTSENSDSVIVDNLPPTAPVLSIDSIGEKSASLSWVCSDNIGVESYDIYRNDELVDSVTTNSYTDSTLDEGTSYIYYVVAYDASKNSSDKSNSVTVFTTIDETQPTIVSISPSNGKYNGVIPIQVTVKDNRSVSKVIIQTSEDKVSWNDIAEVQADGKTNATVEYLLNSSDYTDSVIYVRAYAVNSRNISSDVTLSPVMKYQIDSSAPAAPSDLTIDFHNSQIEIRWTAPNDDDTAYFRIYRKTNSDESFTLVKDNYKYLNYYDTNIELGAEYIYCVTAVDQMGNESAMTKEVSGSIASDNVIPEIVSVYPENGEILDTNQIVGVSAKDNFRLKDIIVECRSAGGEWQTVYTEENINIYAKAIQFELDTSDFTTGSYELRAYAHDTVGNVSEYVIGRYTFKECALSSPALSSVGEGWRNELSWTMDNTDDLLGYHVYRKTAADGKYSLVDSVKNEKYTDNNVTPGKTYYYMVEAVDSRNNKVQSNEAASVPTDTDDVQPLADAGRDVMGITDEKINFNGANSWDNHHIASYEWDFGDGTTETGSKVSHSYKDDGTYDVTLTVKDSAGNTDSHTIKAYIYSNDYGYIQFKTTDTSGRILSGVKIYCEIPGVDSTDFVTDINGNFKFIAPKGKYDVYFYKNEYLPEYVSITVTGENISKKVELEKKQLVEGELTVRNLDINEIVSLGIDVTAPENQFVYEYNIDYGKDGKLTFTLNAMGDIIGEVNGTIQKERNGVFTTVATLKGEKDRPVRAEYGGYKQGSGIPVSVAVFNVTTQVSWLKEFYDVELTVINNADDNFSIRNSQAVLTLPDGLSLADTTRKEDLVQTIGKNGIIGGTETKSASWIVRGDKPGSYDLSAEFTGTLMPLGEDVKVIFKTEDPLVVHDGAGLKLDIMVTEGLDYWTNKFTFTNNSDRPIYNFAASFSGSAELVEVTDMIVKYPSGATEIIKWNNGVPDIENAELYIPVLAADFENPYAYRTVNPGETVTGYFSILRRDGFDNDN